MNKSILYTMLICFISLVFTACGDNAEEISLGFDHEVPSYKVLTDSLSVDPLQQVELKVEVSDNEGLKRLVFSYGDWTINQAMDLEGTPKSYTFTTALTIPQDAEKEWEEEIQRHDGTYYTITQNYHKLTLVATDINMNARTIPIYIKVK